MKTIQFSGVFTALATPMRDGAVAFDDLERLVAHQIEGGVDGLVSVGTTGESPTLSHEEHIEVVRATVAAADGRLPVIAGTGSNATDEAVELTRHADAAGADGFLLVAPYYNKPSQEGMRQHFSRVAETTDKPIALYSIPGRCGVEISVETAARLYEAHPHIRCMKAAEGSCDKVVEYVRTLGDGYAVMSGDDGFTLPFMSVGATGVISVGSNLLARPFADLVRAARDNDFRAATEAFLRYHPFFKAMFLEPNPAPVKHALWRAGVIGSPEVRSPMGPVPDASRDAIDAVLRDLRLDG